MRIDAGLNFSFASQRINAAPSTGSASFADALKVASSGASGDDTDFTSMTRQELRDWMNDQIKSGKMTLDESSAFMPMGMKISTNASSGQSLSVAADAERVDFMELTRAGIDGALSRGDRAEAERLRAALEVMHDNQDRNAAMRA